MAISTIDPPVSKRELTEELQQMRLEAIPFNVRYRLANEYYMQSNVKVKYGGTAFYWDITVTSRSDSVPVPGALSGNSCLRYFDLQWNQKRIFAWDSRKYITYFLPGNHAIITAEPGKVNGPLTAGFPQTKRHSRLGEIDQARAPVQT